MWVSQPGAEQQIAAKSLSWWQQLQQQQLLPVLEGQFDSTGASRDHRACAHKLEAALACQLNLRPPRNPRLGLSAAVDESKYCVGGGGACSHLVP